MQLFDLVKPITDMTDEELLEHLRKIRHNRTVVRPAARKHAERSETKAVRKATKKRADGLDAVLGKLTEEERNALIKQLEGA